MILIEQSSHHPNNAGRAANLLTDIAKQPGQRPLIQALIAMNASQRPH